MSLMYAQMGMSLVNAWGQAGEDAAMYDMQKMQQKYESTMSAIALAQKRNAMTKNETSVADATARASAALEVQSLQDRASLEVGAAAAGVKGGSVRSAMQNLQRSRLMAKANLKKKQQANAAVQADQRHSLTMQHIFNKDISVIQPPSTAMALLGLGASMIDIYDQHQPEGSKVSDTIAGWGRK